MNITKTAIQCSGFKLIMQNSQNHEVGRATLYIMHNDLHESPFGLMEDVYVDDSLRGQGIGTELVKKIIELAQNQKCYKLIATCRHNREKVHALYKNIGFKDHGCEFRIDF